MTNEQKARQIAGISPKANVNNQRFENRCMYVAAMYMYKWTKKRAIKMVYDWLKENIVKETSIIYFGPININFNEVINKLKKEMENKL